MESIQEMIIKKLPDYSKNQKRLANFIIENLQTMPLLSVNQVSERTGVSTATVVRFARLLGFQGYLEFRNQLSEILREQLSPLEKYKNTLSHKNEYKNSLSKIVSTAISNIEYCVEQNDFNEFKHISAHIVKAEHIYSIGMGISHYLAEIMAYLLKLYIKNAFALSNDSPSLPEQVILMTPKDLLIVFSFPPYSRATVEAAQLAKKSNVTVISFTDRKTAPIAEYSDHILVAKTDNILFTNSLGAISVLMNALVTELALAQDKKVIDGLEKIESYLQDKRYFY
jgi:DNA-binding MurR/RpiR family transcriptional regulator